MEHNNLNLQLTNIDLNVRWTLTCIAWSCQARCQIGLSRELQKQPESVQYVQHSAGHSVNTPTMPDFNQREIDKCNKLFLKIVFSKGQVDK